MGKHDAPDQPWTVIFTGYQCERCKGVWATAQVDEGLLPHGRFCLATEGCRGLVVALYPAEGPPPSWLPIYVEWFKPANTVRFREHPYLNDHLDQDGLLMRPTLFAPEWVKRRVGYFGGVRTY